MKLVDGIKHSGRRTHVAVFLLLASVVSLVYWSVVSLGFFSDDYHMLWVTQGHQGSVFSYILTNLIGERGGHSYGPTFNIVFTAQYALFGMRALGYHVVSILFHLATSFFLYLLVYRLLGRRSIAVVTGLLFAVFHTHVSSIAWISVQPHLIATCMTVLGMWLYLLFLDTRKNVWYVGALLAFLFGVFAKEIAITFPLLMVVLVVWRRKQSSWTAVFKRCCMHLLFPAIIVVTYLFLRRYTTGISIGFYAQEQIPLDLARMWHMFLELTANMFVAQPYRHVLVVWADTHIVRTLFGFAVLASLPYIFVKKKSWDIYVASLVYGLLTLPVLQVGYNTLTNEGERYTYLPSTFFIFASVLLCWNVGQRLKKNAQYFFRGVLLFSCILWSVVLSYDKLADWQVTNTIVHDVLRSYTSLSFEPDDYIYLIGMPDTLNGAQLFRNASIYMFALETKTSPIHGDRISMFHMITKQAYQQSQSSVVQNNVGDDVDTWKMRDPEMELGSRAFHGVPIVEHTYANFSLDDFRKTDESGTAIHIVRSPTQIAQAQKDDVRIGVLYYTNGTLEKLYLDEEKGVINP
ncbi:MAG: hypothetical protein COU32_01950 [Candidatus Magasanikbacteria bacterium CG10_big_fil_rev_8_21_14_0_10_42_10]|uniref:Glycosyltransferase RgtA/B/C/D-like domain-containing protein n=2 Tax=Candidatus Magasanikiibacteriota TaxID=1752731 RepID=A0A2H0TWG2_9BACT|nr:MAG: hypothetical protein COU32_01950 [Candidatus Magasanikbacteria bacterium CG10_big_fil_rev_8_21_14_0_10_42_10]PIZ92752.1 MAG: hypothetical protein COX82_04075 [Candidatus Magasanikbacteria bacterium CG_4_10_14_0_2_um_filter_41_10]